MSPPVSVILIREFAQQLTGSGCCGKIIGSDRTLRGRELFQLTRKHQLELGVLHQAVRKFFPQLDGRDRVAVVVVDPRNQLYLIPKLLGDVLRYRPGWLAGLQTALQMFSLPAVVVNGRIISRHGGPLEPDTLCHTIGELLD
jgi:hypothetical protein